MPWSPVKLAAGLNVELTPTINQASYTATNLGRFKGGIFQKLGGWKKYCINSLSGIPRKLHAWQDLAGNKRLACGSTIGLNDITSGNILEISPQTLTTNPTINFATTIGSNIVTIVDTAVSNITTFDSVYFNTPVSVGGLILSGLYSVSANLSATSYLIVAASNATSTVIAPGGSIPAFTTTSASANVSVTFTAHGLLSGNDIIFPLATVVGGLTISGRYIVQSITDTNTFVITAANSASSSAGPTSMNSGKVGFLYYITTGPQAGGGAYGSGNYGDGTYGFGTVITGQTGSPIGASEWTLDNWGEFLISCPQNGGIYYWGPASGYQNSSLISSGPAFNSGTFVSIAQQIVIAYGSSQNATVGVYQDPLLVRWTDVGNFTSWTSTVTNQAGNYRIPTGSAIVGGAATPYRNLIWTDLDLWSMDYIGSTFVFGFNKIGSNCGLIAKHASAQLSNVVYWMGKSAFFSLSYYGVQQLSCPVWDAVFQDLDIANSSKCVAGANTNFSEVWFFYPSLSGGLGYCDKYAKHNVIEGTWDVGTLSRVAWIDQSVIGPPTAATQNGIIYTHESGNDADTDALIPSFDTGWFYVDEGREIVFVDRIFPDFRWGLFNGSQDATINITIKSVMYPGDTPNTYGPFSVTQASQYISQRFRARQISLSVSSSDVGSFWRLGLIRVRWAPDGRL